MIDASSLGVQYLGATFPVCRGDIMVTGNQIVVCLESASQEGQRIRCLVVRKWWNKND